MYLLLKVYILAFPLFFLSFTTETHEFNKLFLTYLFSLVFLLLFVLHSVAKKQIKLAYGLIPLSLLLIVGASLASTFSQSPQKLLSIGSPLTTGSWIAALCLYVIITGTDLSQRLHLMSLLVFDALVISVFAIGSYLHVIPNQFALPAGDLLTTFLFLASLSLYTLIYLLGRLKPFHVLAPKPYKGHVRPVLYLIALLVITGTTLWIGMRLFTDQKPFILPLTYGWKTLAETMKQPNRFLLGVGPGNFLSAYSIGKPIEVNTTSFWNATFISSSSFFFTLWNENGVIAAIGYILIAVSAIKGLLGRKNLLFAIPFFFLYCVGLFLPSSQVLFITFLVLLGFSQPVSFPVIPLTNFHWLRPILFICTIGWVCIILYMLAHVYVADIYFRRSLDSLSSNNPQLSYMEETKALQLNPQHDGYHRAFSQLNLLIAGNIWKQADLTDEQKTIATALTRQSVEHAKIALALYPNPINWDNLAETYTTLLTSTEGSYDWAVASYQEKIKLDPYNPANRVLLAQLYISQNQFPQATNLLQQAIDLKPDYVNAHYNLAMVLKEEHKYPQAYRHIQTALSFTPQSSSEREILQNEIEQVKQLLPVSTSIPTAIPNE